MRMEDGMGEEREGGRMVATDDGISAPARTEIPQRAVIYRCREKQNGKLLAATLREAEEGALDEASEVSRPIHGFQIVLPTLSFQQAPRAKKIDGLHQCGTRGVINHDAADARHQTISLSLEASSAFSCTHHGTLVDRVETHDGDVEGDQRGGPWKEKIKR